MAGLSSLACAAEPPKPVTISIADTTVSFEMVPVPAGKTEGGKDIKPFMIGKCEVTWDEYDVCVFKLDMPDGSRSSTPGADAVTRPTKPYLTADHGYGHQGYPVICVSANGAKAYCEWLSAKTGKKFRLATEDEWEYACRAGSKSPFVFSDDAAGLEDFAWSKSNSEAKSHSVASKEPNAWGIHDMLGNVREWVQGRDGEPVAKGGSFRDEFTAMKPEAREPNKAAWNASDPQIPKSKWWLADGPFMGFRVVCEAE